MDISRLLSEIYMQLLVAVITFIFGVLAAKIPTSLNKYKLRQFFGADFFSDSINIVYGLFQRIKDVQQLNEAVYEKVYSDGSKYEVFPPPFLLTGPDAVRGIAHFLQEFSKYRNKPFIVTTDKEALSNLQKNTFICVGGSISNEMSKYALAQENNKSLRFSLPSENRGYASIVAIKGKEKFERGNEIGHDFGVIIKVRNQLSADKRFFFVCAGIGSLGTSAALWYLSNHWKELYKEFGSNEFGIVVEVNNNEDNITKRIYPKVSVKSRKAG